jgi:hypothetical protein
MKFIESLPFFLFFWCIKINAQSIFYSTGISSGEDSDDGGTLDPSHGENNFLDASLDCTCLGNRVPRNTGLCTQLFLFMQ